MKKTTLILLLTLVQSLCLAQSYDTGTVNLTDKYSIRINVNTDTDLVTLTLFGPPNRYLGLGFNVVNMINNGDCVIYTGTFGTGNNILTDRTYNNATTAPSLDSGSNAQNWTVTTNVVESTFEGGVPGSRRKVVATRPRVSPGDFTFPSTAGPLNLAWSFANTDSYDLVYHGTNRGSTTVNFILNDKNFTTESVKMYPNPAQDYVVIEMPSMVVSGVVKIYDTLGKLVKKQTITSSDNSITTDDLNTGTYMVVVRTEYGNIKKTLIVE